MYEPPTLRLRADEWRYPACVVCGRYSDYLDRDGKTYCFACWSDKGGMLPPNWRQ